MQIKLHTDPVQATFHDAAYEPCRSEIRALLNDFYRELPEADCNTHDNQACENIIAKVQDQLVACGALHTSESGVWEIKNLFTKGYEENVEITKKMTQLLIKKARKSGCYKLRHSLPSDWTITTEMLLSLGFRPVTGGNHVSGETVTTMELSLDA